LQGYDGNYDLLGPCAVSMQTVIHPVQPQEAPQSANYDQMT